MSFGMACRLPLPARSTVSLYRALRPSQRRLSRDIAALDRLLEAVYSRPGLLAVPPGPVEPLVCSEHCVGVLA